MAAILIVSLAVSYPQQANSNQQYSGSVLNWASEAQKSFIEISISMTAILASQKKETESFARCINDWYFKDSSKLKSRNDEILNGLKRFPDFHPQGVILGLLEKHCGKFGE